MTIEKQEVSSSENIDAFSVSKSTISLHLKDSEMPV
jgi:hypothetical protein